MAEWIVMQTRRQRLEGLNRFDCSRVIALLLVKFAKGAVISATRQERKLAQTFERVLLDAAYSDLTVEAEKDEEGGQ
ncbi:hypothetical protein Y032_0010g1060 [Ancylostoma ceylanicum]|uniref:Uncharacterized protein n=1 Tax=Ancylostoma ceylanicum TaxID=53326 RepID=A0A016VGW9_9BILA|nr:hypothetical protein Y032_0010g1060 [Ancylostoma ceylanicum]